MLATVGFTQLKCRLGTPFLDLEFDEWDKWCTPNWVTHLWQECSKQSIQLWAGTGQTWIPTLQWEGDKYLKDHATKWYEQADLKKLNDCRIYLQITTLTDITSIDGRVILHAYYKSQHGQSISRGSKYNWPQMGQLSTSYWGLWQDFLNRIAGTPRILHLALVLWYSNVECSQEFAYCLDTDDQLFHWNFDTAKMMVNQKIEGHSQCVKKYECQARPTDIPLHKLWHPQFVDVTQTDTHLIIISQPPAIQQLPFHVLTKLLQSKNTMRKKSEKQSKDS